MKYKRKPTHFLKTKQEANNKEKILEITVNRWPNDIDLSLARQEITMDIIMAQ